MDRTNFDIIRTHSWLGVCQTEFEVGHLFWLNVQLITDQLYQQWMVFVFLQSEQNM